ncbi:(Na+)-NQR maturation NqrM [Catenovulum maritimum]|uniref:Na(+)-translocating NADH-quinone reductase subunit E n=1 Tax=Catenovulum maritimum TaxID=1513271 RepID=A0A0J8GLL1_9ALTE|nr:(Na+)-NQR maturation NqrM [Catenovulum maritimum]KMT63695.1 Na(+)-translocating NADH-quinone reductase subunit E [Catenovulum maritimum]
MFTFIIAFAVFLLVVIAMSVGYWVQQKTIAGSCGGLGTLGIEKACDCDNPCEKRQERMKKEEKWKENQIL